MKLRDIINPWGALADARREIRHHERALDSAGNVLRSVNDQQRVDTKAHDLQVKNLRAEIHRLEAVIANGHYRNPQTGRIGRKGERFDAGAAH